MNSEPSSTFLHRQCFSHDENSMATIENSRITLKNLFMINDD